LDGYRFHLVNDATPGLDPIDGLSPTAASGAPDLDRANRFVTMRPAAEIDRLWRDVAARLALNGGND
jgi:hypothetical protein